MPPKRKLVMNEINTEQICDYLLTKDQILDQNCHDLFAVFQEKESYKSLKNIGLHQISAATEWISTPCDEIQKKARMHYDRIRQLTSTLEDEFDEIIKEKLNGVFRATIKEEILKFIRKQSIVGGDESFENIVEDENFLGDKQISEIIVDQQSPLINEDNSEIILDRPAPLADEGNSEIILHRRASFADEGDSEIILPQQASLADEDDSEMIPDRQGSLVEDNNSEILDVLNGVENGNDSEIVVNGVNEVVKIKKEILSDEEGGKTGNKKPNGMFLSGSDIEEIFLDSPLSSVHTSDLSSFDDEISISSEEGNEKRRVSLKFAEEEIQRVKEIKALEEHKQEKRKKTKKTSNGHQSQEDSSDSASANSSRRVRKPNSKYFSKDVLSSQKTSSVSRKRGRPRKHSTDLGIINSNHVSSTFDASWESKDASDVPRKRGRPKKC